MTTFTTPMLALLLLLATTCHVTRGWDASNIWFPDTNNPVFYNLTFYPQPSSSDTADDSASSTEPPKIQSNNNNNNNNDALEPSRLNSNGQNRQPERVPLFRPQESSGQEITSRPSNVPSRQPTRVPIFRPQEVATKQSTQETLNPRPSNSNGQNRQPARNPNFNQQAPLASQPGNSRPSSDTNRNNGKGQNRQPTRNQQRENTNTQTRPPMRNQQVTRTTPSTDSRASYTQLPTNDNNNNNNKQNLQPSRNRLRRTKNNGIGDAGTSFVQPSTSFGDYRNSRASDVAFEDTFYYPNARQGNMNQQYSRDLRNVGNRDANIREQREETTNSNGFENGVRFTRPSGDNRRSWNTNGDGSSVARKEIEENIIADAEATPSPSGPSKCVWAIISCCKPSSPQIRYMCFETLGCHGAFWDINPCSPEITMAAVQATANFFNVARDEN